MGKKKMCKVPSCIREVKARDMCATHHTRMLRYFKENNTENEEEFIQFAYKRDTRSLYCSVYYCRRPVHGKGLCHNHYHLYYYHLKRENITSIDDYLDMQKVDCYIPNCEEKVVSKGFCRRHYNRYHNHIKKGTIQSKAEFLSLLAKEKDKPKVCRVILCEDKPVAKSLCHKHYQRYMRHDADDIADYLQKERENMSNLIDVN